MQRIETNVHEKELCVKLVIYKDLKCPSDVIFRNSKGVNTEKKYATADIN
jgi:hypothetical protein